MLALSNSHVEFEMTDLSGLPIVSPWVASGHLNGLDRHKAPLAAGWARIREGFTLVVVPVMAPRTYGVCRHSVPEVYV